MHFYHYNFVARMQYIVCLHINDTYKPQELDTMNITQYTKYTFIM